MKKRIRNLITMLIVMVMVVGMMPLTAMADAPEIGHLTVTVNNLAAPVLTNRTDAVEIMEYKWEKAGEVIEGTRRYRLEIRVEIKEGVDAVFTSYPTMIVNGTEAELIRIAIPPRTYVVYYYDVRIPVSEEEKEIRDIAFSMEKPAAGTKKPQAISSTTGAKVRETSWFEGPLSEHGTTEVTQFETGKTYYCVVTLIPEEGYAFPETANEMIIKYAGQVVPSNHADNYANAMLEIQIEKASASKFTDVKTTDFYYEPVSWAVEKGITGGTTDTTFSPDKPCTRAQAVTFLWRAAGSPAYSGSNPFKDVPNGAFYHDAVLWAVNQGITKGTTDTTFSPDADCTRGQIVTFMYRAAGSPAASGASFQDVSAKDYCAKAVQWAVSQGITMGTTATTFSQNKECTRAQIVTFIYRQTVS